MKLIKFTQKRKFKRKRKRKIISNFKCFIIILFLTFYCAIAIIIILSFLRKLQKKKKLEDEINDYNKIKNKGEKIQRDELLKNYISRIKNGGKSLINEMARFKNFYFLPEYTDDPISRNIFKNKFLSFFSRYKKRPTNKIETFFLSDNYFFGNNVIIMNNAIFYCEILGCNKIILNDRRTNRKWLINNTIYIEKLNITIEKGHKVNCSEDTVFCPSLGTWDGFKPIIVKAQIRIQYIKDEIIRNIPKVITEPKDLYIHIRGGDIFKLKKPSHYYAQPPLCFYEKIINNNKFKHIYIISMDRRNVVLTALIDKYKYIIFERNDYTYDLSLLINAFNIVASVSSFVISAIKFNDNLKELWEYDIYRLSEKFSFLHHHVYKLDIKYTIHTMKPSDVYADQMFIWLNNENQLKLMIEETCPYDFVLTKPNR